MNAIEPSKLKRKLKNGESLVLLDVRTPVEFEHGHIAGAKNVPLPDLDPSVFLKDHTKPGDEIYVVCQAGARAQKAVEAFRESGFVGCHLVNGGMEAWLQAGFPIEKSRAMGLPLSQQVQLTVGTIVAVGSLLTMVVDPQFIWIPLFMGCGLIFAGTTGFCGLALILARMPWNRLSKHTGATCSVGPKAAL